MKMLDSEHHSLTKTYDEVIAEAQVLIGRVDEQLDAFPMEEFPKNGARLACLRGQLGGIAAMATHASESIDDESDYAVRPAN